MAPAPTPSSIPLRGDGAPVELRVWQERGSELSKRARGSGCNRHALGQKPEVGCFCAEFPMDGLKAAMPWGRKF